MTRVKRAAMTHKRHKRVMKAAAGYWGRRHKSFRIAHQAVMKAMDDAFRGRKQRKRDFRALWITRINAGCREHGMSYNRFMDGLNKSSVEVNRKMLSEMAIHDPEGFAQLVEKSRAALA